ncbi:MAG: hypothetical protein J6T10_28080 [Methanobrevibacter sp.]|nr:hypothetical protein [Methanobrevibacter sp.]
MIDRLYYRVQDLIQLWRNIKFRWKLLTYRDKYRNEPKGEKGNTDE